MATDTNLPENDADLLLARSLGNVLSEGRAFSELGDELVDLLVDHKDQEIYEYQHNHVPAEAIWSAIQSKTSARVLPFYQRSSTLAWAAAAVVLIAAFIGFYWMSLGPVPQLLAQSDSTIQMISLEDGSEVTLRPYSKVFLLNADEQERTYSLEGEAFFDVVSDPDRPFSVSSGEGTVTVLGTRFNLSNWGNKTSVFLEEGSVRFSAEGKEVILKPGERAFFGAGMMSEPEIASEAVYTDWINNTIIFDGSSPDDVVAEIGQHYNISINIDALKDRSTIDGTLRLDSIDQTLEDLGLVLGGSFRETVEKKYTFISQE